jgi:hypothetical protein
MERNQHQSAAMRNVSDEREDDLHSFRISWRLGGVFWLSK